MKLPDRWLQYTKSKRIDNTPFVACKVPLRENFSTVLTAETRFTPRDLLVAHPDIKMVVDLTQTTKYYNGTHEFINNNIRYLKIFCRGNNIIPTDAQFQTFANAVNEFLWSHPRGSLIAVHCTHGINRTGYFIVRYMIEEMGFDSETALKNFMLCRSHVMERENLIDDLLKRKSKHQPETTNRR